MEKIIVVYAIRAIQVILVVVETTQALKKIREAFERASK